MTPARLLRAVPDAARLVELGVRAPAGRCGVLTHRADRCRMPGAVVAGDVATITTRTGKTWDGEPWTLPLSLCRSHRCRAVEGVALHVIGSDGWLWRIGERRDR